MSETSNAAAATLNRYSLTDRYTRESGGVFLTGTQALVRILIDQRDRDIADGINSAGFVSGYRGSPLGGVDLELWRAQHALKARRIEFLPAVNEDLAATAVLGSQQVETDSRREVDGVFGLWYGKGPGVDRSGDALKHGNAYGSSPHGGVLHADAQSGQRRRISRLRRIRLCAEPVFRNVGGLQGDFGNRGIIGLGRTRGAATVRQA
jgi:indolepyruvate ferredoxin oxidoreductase